MDPFRAAIKRFQSSTLNVIYIQLKKIHSSSSLELQADISNEELIINLITSIILTELLRLQVLSVPQYIS